ncbi:MAG: ABC transporter substrate-binding protein [Candidatus Bipolaricaulia bacterium]
MRALRLMVVLALMVAVFTGPAWAQKQELHMYTAFDVDESRIYINAFMEAYPDIEVKWVRMSSGEVLARVRAEARNPQASIWFAGPSTSHIAAAQDGLLLPYCSVAWQYLSAAFKDPECRWTGFYTGFIGFASNKNFLEEHNLEPPTSWFDLLRPEYKNEISKAFPYTSGTAYTTLISQLQAIGPEKQGWDTDSERYIEQLSQQMHHYTRSGSACVTETGLGEVGACIAFSHDVLAKGVSKGYPVVLSFPKEGTGFEIGAVSLIKGGPEPELAKVFYDWLMTAEAQSLFQRWFRVPLNPEAELAEGLVKAADVAIIAGFGDRITWYGQRKDAIIDKWREITGR